jgi:hypothetical protein
LPEVYVLMPRRPASLLFRKHNDAAGMNVNALQPAVSAHMVQQAAEVLVGWLSPPGFRSLPLKSVLASKVQARGSPRTLARTNQATTEALTDALIVTA